MHCVSQPRQHTPPETGQGCEWDQGHAPTSPVHVVETHSTSSEREIVDMDEKLLAAFGTQETFDLPVRDSSVISPDGPLLRDHEPQDQALGERGDHPGDGQGKCE